MGAPILSYRPVRTRLSPLKPKESVESLLARPLASRCGCLLARRTLGPLRSLGLRLLLRRRPRLLAHATGLLRLLRTLATALGLNRYTTSLLDHATGVLHPKLVCWCCPTGPPKDVSLPCLIRSPGLILAVGPITTEATCSSEGSQDGHLLVPAQASKSRRTPYQVSLSLAIRTITHGISSY